MQLGDFRQTLTFVLPTPQRPQLTLELRGTVEGRASILGDERWDTEHDIWSLGEWKRGTIKRDSGLTLVLVGDQRKTLKPRVVTHSPEWIGVEFGQAQYLAERNQTHLPLSILIPETAPSVLTPVGRSADGARASGYGAGKSPQAAYFAAFYNRLASIDIPRSDLPRCPVLR